MAWWKWLLAGAGLGMLVIRKLMAGRVFKGNVLMKGKVKMLLVFEPTFGGQQIEKQTLPARSNESPSALENTPWPQRQ